MYSPYYFKTCILYVFVIFGQSYLCMNVSLAIIRYLNIFCGCEKNCSEMNKSIEYEVN